MRKPPLWYVLGKFPLTGDALKTVLFSFPDDVTRDRYLQWLKTVSDSASGDNSVLAIKTLGTVKLDPPIKAEHERFATLYVSGQKLIEGPLADMRARFKQEVDSHSASVELRELREGSWVVIQARRHQRQ